MGAPRPQHLSIRPNHLDKLACEVCHIPALHVAAAEGFDVTTGKMVNYPKIGAKKIGERLHLAAPVLPRAGTRASKIWPVNRFMLPVTLHQPGQGRHQLSPLRQGARQRATPRSRTS